MVVVPLLLLTMITADEPQPQRPRIQDLCTLVCNASNLAILTPHASCLSRGSKLEPRAAESSCKGVGHPRLSVLPLTVVCLVFGTRHFL